VKKNAPKIVVISFWQRNKIGIFGYGGGPVRKMFMTKTPANYLANLAVDFGAMAFV